MRGELKIQLRAFERSLRRGNVRFCLAARRCAAVIFFRRHPVIVVQRSARSKSLWARESAALLRPGRLKRSTSA